MLELYLHQDSKRIVGESYFIEELSNAQFTTYATVASLVGVAQGTLINEGQGWLRFHLDGKELIVSKKPMRNRISWDHLNSVGCVFGTKVITINGNQYKVRLLTGADHNPTQLPSPGYGNYLEGSHNSEWSRLFYPLVTDDAYLNDQYIGPKDPRYTNMDLGVIWVNDAVTPGAYSWCQETPSAFPTDRVLRGYLGVSYLIHGIASNTDANRGWRPCLELIHSHEAPTIQVASYYNPEDFEMAPSNLHHAFFSDPNTL